MNGNLIGAVNTPTLASAPGVWDIEELKLAQQQNTWPLLKQPDPYFEYVSLLLSSETAAINGAKNNTFQDSSTNNFTITRNGNTTQGSFSPYLPNWSNYFDGTGDNLLINYNSALHLSADFTIECWFYANAHGGMILNLAGGLNIAWASYQLVSNGDGINFAGSSANSGYDIGSQTGATGRIGTIQLGTWNHLAVTRSGNVYRGFVNGVQGYTQTLALTPYNPNARGLAIGGTYANTWGSGTPTDVVNGYISNVRIIKDTAVYTSNFTPPSEPLPAVAGTSLLTCQSNRFIDNSTNNFTITRNGDTRITPFSPFSSFVATKGYVPATYGGSGYFDGTGDYLSNTANNPINFGTSNFTVELWFYMTTLPGTSFQVLLTTNPQSNNGFQIYRSSSSGNIVYGAINASENIIIPASEFSINQWYHIAILRAGTGTNQTSVYVNGVQKYTYTDSINYNINGVNIGGYSTILYFPGYITGVRVIKGTALYTANFTPPTEPLTAVAGTSLLINFTNGGIIDSAALNVAETDGNAQVSTSVKKYGSGSYYFDGTGDYLIMPDVLTGQFGTGDFTIEYWDYHGSQGTNYGNQVGTLSSGTAAGTWRFGTYSNNGGVYLGYHNGSTFVDVPFGTTAYNDSTWRHFALTRSGTTVRAFVDGVQVGSNATITQNFNSANRVSVGAELFSPTYFNGYINDLRVTKGIARYTANFIPPIASLPTF